MSELTEIEKLTAKALQAIREGNVPPIPEWLRTAFREIELRHPDFVAETQAIIRRTIEKTTH
jgi:hypothetical protein